MKGCKNRNSFKRIICFFLIKDLIFYEIIITVFQFTRRAIENRSTCHAWHACRRLPTPGLRCNSYPLTFSKPISTNNNVCVLVINKKLWTIVYVALVVTVLCSSQNIWFVDWWMSYCCVSVLLCTVSLCPQWSISYLHARSVNNYEKELVIPPSKSWRQVL